MLAACLSRYRSAVAHWGTRQPGAQQAPVAVPVSLGELADKVTILSLKTTRIRDSAKVATAQHEYAALHSLLRPHLPRLGAAGEHLVSKLGRVNGRLWDLENYVRRAGLSDAQLASSCRQICSLNDARARLKAEINEAAGDCQFQEVKEHHWGS